MGLWFANPVRRLTWGGSLGLRFSVGPPPRGAPVEVAPGIVTMNPMSSGIGIGAGPYSAPQDDVCDLASPAKQSYASVGERLFRGSHKTKDGSRVQREGRRPAGRNRRAILWTKLGRVPRRDLDKHQRSAPRRSGGRAPLFLVRSTISKIERCTLRLRRKNPPTRRSESERVLNIIGTNPRKSGLIWRAAHTHGERSTLGVGLCGPVVSILIGVLRWCQERRAMILSVTIRSQRPIVPVPLGRKDCNREKQGTRRGEGGSDHESRSIVR